MYKVFRMPETTTVTVRVPKKLKSRLAKLALATERSSSWLAARALESYVDSQEWQIAAIRRGKRDVRAGRTVSHSKVTKWLRSWGTKREEAAPACE